MNYKTFIPNIVRPSITSNCNYIKQCYLFSNTWWCCTTQYVHFDRGNNNSPTTRWTRQFLARYSQQFAYKPYIILNGNNNFHPLSLFVCLVQTGVRSSFPFISSPVFCVIFDTVKLARVEFPPWWPSRGFNANYFLACDLMTTLRLCLHNSIPGALVLFSCHLQMIIVPQFG